MTMFIDTINTVLLYNIVKDLGLLQFEDVNFYIGIPDTPWLPDS